MLETRLVSRPKILASSSEFWPQPCSTGLGLKISCCYTLIWCQEFWIVRMIRRLYWTELAYQNYWCWRGTICWANWEKATLVSILVDRVSTVETRVVCIVSVCSLEECLKILIETNRLPEAAFFARTYMPSELSRWVIGAILKKLLIFHVHLIITNFASSTTRIKSRSWIPAKIRIAHL